MLDRCGIVTSRIGKTSKYLFVFVCLFANNFQLSKKRAEFSEFYDRLPNENETKFAKDVVKIAKVLKIEREN